jgi:Ala-tRNA(Pro) deacylase
MRVPSFLADQRVHFETLVHPPAFTASRRARCLHVPGKQLAKCVLLVGSTRSAGTEVLPGRQDLLAIVPATHHVDLEKVAINLDCQVRLATSDEIPEVFRDCEWGGLVPFGSLYGLQTLLDISFDPEVLLVFEAHQHAVAIRMPCRDFERLEKPRRFAFAK